MNTGRTRGYTTLETSVRDAPARRRSHVPGRARGPPTADARVRRSPAGWRGLLHAFVVPLATHMIDRFAYSGVDARKFLHESEFPDDADVVDLCCGVGFSCARNGRVTAVDTSEQMLAIAKLRRSDVHTFAVGNAETWGEVRARAQRRAAQCRGSLPRSRAPHDADASADGRCARCMWQSASCDISTVMFGMHEMPAYARRRVIRNALRIARSKVLIVDIWPGFEPTPMMLSGEPFVLDYLANVDDDIDSSYDPEEWQVTRVDVVEEHVRMWKFEKVWGI
jgi:SAM-dependent methyltransferase